MTLSHEKNKGNGLPRQNHMEMRYYTCSLFDLKKISQRVPKGYPADTCSGHPLEPESTIKHRPYRETSLSYKMSFDNWTTTPTLVSEWMGRYLLEYIYNCDNILFLCIPNLYTVSSIFLSFTKPIVIKMGKVTGRMLIITWKNYHTSWCDVSPFINIKDIFDHGRVVCPLDHWISVSNTTHAKYRTHSTNQRCHS